MSDISKIWIQFVEFKKFLFKFVNFGSQSANSAVYCSVKYFDVRLNIQNGVLGGGELLVRRNVKVVFVAEGLFEVLIGMGDRKIGHVRPLKVGLAQLISWVHC